jgi:hypothetical protein
MKNIKTYEQFIGESKSGLYTIEDYIQENAIRGIKSERKFIENNGYLAEDANFLFGEIMKMPREDRLAFYNQTAGPEHMIYENRTGEAAEFISGTNEGGVFELLNNQCRYSIHDKYVMVIGKRGVVSFGEDLLPTDSVEYMKEFYYSTLGLSSGDILSFASAFGYDDKLGMEENWSSMKHGWCDRGMFETLYNMYRKYCEKNGLEIVSR